jgi:hypothetical protein
VLTQPLWSVLVPAAAVGFLRERPTDEAAAASKSKVGKLAAKKS